MALRDILIKNSISPENADKFHKYYSSMTNFTISPLFLLTSK